MPEPTVCPDLSLVICTLNESESIESVLEETLGALRGVTCEIIVVDDSTDERTAEAVMRAMATEPAVRLLRRSGGRGLASAAIEGWKIARGRVLGLMDGDGQHDPALLAPMLRQVAEGADLSVASRFAPLASLGLTGLRKAMSQGGTAIVHAVLGARTTDPLAGYFLMTRDWFQDCQPKLTGVGFKILVDLLMSGDRRPVVREVGTSLRPRFGGESKLDLRVVVELLAQLVERRTGALIKARFVMFAGVGASGIAIHAAALSILQMFLSFGLAQAGAIVLAMIWNYNFNNLLTFRDRRLQGAAFWRGMAAFGLACGVGAIISEATAVALAGGGAHWLAAGLTGAVAAAAWNYLAASRLAWRAGAALPEAQLVREIAAPA